jgi:hypothetical protein
MKNLKNMTSLLMLVILASLAGCKKDPVMYSKGLTSFNFIVKDQAGATKEYPGTISGDQIVVQLPTEVDVTELVASFTTENARTIVQVGTVVQESGISVQDFTSAVRYKIKAEDKSTRTYTVSVDKKIALQSFGFYKGDNPDLTEDYVAVIKGLDVDIAVPESVNQTNLIARFQTTTGVTMKVGNTIQESKKTPNDFSNPLIYTLNEGSLTTPFQYSINLSFLGRQWTLFGDNLTVPTAAGIKMAVSPITGYPYFIYQRTGKDEAGVTIPNDNKKVAVMGYLGTEWKNIGSATGVSDFRADVPGIAFDKDGNPYIGYKDYLNGDQKATVQKYNGTAWSVVGSSRFTPIKVDYLSFAMTQNDVPMVAMAKTGTDATGVPARGLYVMNYLNAAWSSITPPGGITIFYDQLITGLDGNIYLGIMDRSTGVNKPSLYVYKNNAWTAVGPTSFTAPDGMVGFQGVSVAVDKNGQAYLAFQVAPTAGRLNHVMKLNKTTNQWQELGNAVSTGGEKDKFVLAVDQNDQLYFAYANATSLIVKTFNTATNNWNTERKVISEKVNEFDMQIGPDGTVYIVASLLSSNKTVVYKYAK